MGRRKRAHRHHGRDEQLVAHESHTALVYEAEQAPRPAEVGGRTADQQCDWAGTWNKTRNRERRS